MSCAALFKMAVAIKTEHFINDDPVIKLKLESASIVENIVKSVDAKISTSCDFKILADSILKTEAIQCIIANQSILSKPQLVNFLCQTSYHLFSLLPKLSWHLRQCHHLPASSPASSPESLPASLSASAPASTPVSSPASTPTSSPASSPATTPNQESSSTQTCQDDVILSNLNKISKLEGELSKMDQN